MATDDRTFVGGGAAATPIGGRDLLESMTVNSQGITYKINAFGQRVSEAFSGTTTHYIHDIRGNIIAEANGNRRDDDGIRVDGRPASGADRLVRQHLLCA